jgi:hypothetical protein
MLQITILKPQGDPLYLHSQRLVIEHRIHMLDGIVKACRRRQELIIGNVGGEPQPSDFDREDWRHGSLHHRLHGDR